MNVVEPPVVVVEPVVPDEVRVIGDPVRSPFTSALELALEPAKSANEAASLPLAAPEVDGAAVVVLPVAVLLLVVVVVAVVVVLLVWASARLPARPAPRAMRPRLRAKRVFIVATPFRCRPRVVSRWRRAFSLFD